MCDEEGPFEQRFDALAARSMNAEEGEATKPIVPRVVRLLFALPLILGSCGAPNTSDAGPDGAPHDGGVVDADRDASLVDASPGDAPPSDAPSPLDDAGRRCTVATAAADCDDGNPRTTDMCFVGGAPDGVGFCLSYECSTDAACDDGDPITEDRCNVGSFLCEHWVLPNRCHAAADCTNELTPSCVSAACDARALCSFDWSEGCGIEPPEVLPTCAAVGALEGATCCDGPVCTSVCTLSGDAGDCPVRLACLAGHYTRIAPAGAACPSAACPPEPPAAAASCSSLGAVCDYAPRRRIPSADAPSEHLGDGPRCTCTGTGWSCVGDVCPSRPPLDGAPADDLPSWVARPGLVCDYLGRQCMRLLSGGAASATWRCITPIACPARAAAPTGAEPCLSGADDRCSYGRFTADQPVTTYSGACTCAGEGSDAAWSCEPSRSALCPAAEPMEGAMCTRATGNSDCTYIPADPRELTRRCACNDTAPGLPARWRCF